jgi:hypothetical protein
MDSKFLFLVGVLILILSTCSVDTAPAARGIDREALVVSVCLVEKCPATSIKPDGH